MNLLIKNINWKTATTMSLPASVIILDAPSDILDTPGILFVVLKKAFYGIRVNDFDAVDAGDSMLDFDTFGKLIYNHNPMWVMKWVA